MTKFEQQRIAIWELENPEPSGFLEHIKWLDKRKRDLRVELVLEKADSEIDYKVNNKIIRRSPRNTITPFEKISFDEIEKEWAMLSPLGSMRGSAAGLLKGHRGDGHILRTGDPDLI